MSRIVLASASPRRKELLEKIGRTLQSGRKSAAGEYAPLSVI